MIKKSIVNFIINFEEKKMVKKSKLFSVFFVLVICLLSAGLGNGAVLFSETWNSGVINADWTVLGRTGISNLENLGGGDYALALRGYQDPCYPGARVDSWSDCIYSAATFPRSPGNSERIYVQYKAWYKVGVNVQTAMHGGWHFGIDWVASITRLKLLWIICMQAFKASEDVYQNWLSNQDLL